MNYEQQLQQNRIEAGQDAKPWLAEWNLLLTTKYAYDPTYDYVGEGGTLSRLANEYKREGIYDDPVVAARNVLTQQPTEKSAVNKHKLAWVYWIDYKKKDFIKDWKPKDDEGLNYMHITLNFTDKMPMNEVLVETHRIVNLPILERTKITYSYEYYTDKGNHPHVHMLVELKRTGTISPSSFIDDVFKKKALKEKLNVHYKFSWARDYEKRCDKRAVVLAYVSGNKIEEKMANVEKDKLWRRENNLEDLYIKDN